MSEETEQLRTRVHDLEQQLARQSELHAGAIKQANKDIDGLSQYLWVSLVLCLLFAAIASMELHTFAESVAAYITADIRALTREVLLVRTVLFAAPVL